MLADMMHSWWWHAAKVNSGRFSGGPAQSRCGSTPLISTLTSSSVFYQSNAFEGHFPSQIYVGAWIETPKPQKECKDGFRSLNFITKTDRWSWSLEVPRARSGEILQR